MISLWLLPVLAIRTQILHFGGAQWPTSFRCRHYTIVSCTEGVPMVHQDLRGRPAELGPEKKRGGGRTIKRRSKRRNNLLVAPKPATMQRCWSNWSDESWERGRVVTVWLWSSTMTRAMSWISSSNSENKNHHRQIHALIRGEYKISERGRRSG